MANLLNLHDDRTAYAMYEAASPAHSSMMTQELERHRTAASQGSNPLLDPHDLRVNSDLSPTRRQNEEDLRELPALHLYSLTPNSINLIRLYAVVGVLR